MQNYILEKKKIILIELRHTQETHNRKSTHFILFMMEKVCNVIIIMITLLFRFKFLNDNRFLVYKTKKIPKFIKLHNVMLGRITYHMY